MKLKTHAPTPEMVRAARDAAELTQPQAAEIAELGSPQRWSEYERGINAIDDTRWQLFLLKTGQHPKFTLEAR